VREAMDWGWTGDGALTSAGACIQLFVVAGVDGGAAATILVSNLVQSVWRAQHAGSAGCTCARHLVEAGAERT
jgi:hypothetical protein